MAIFWSKVGIFGLSPILRALGAKKQIVGTHRSRKHNLQHPYAPKYAIFHENRPKMALFLSNIDFLALYKQLKDPPPPHFERAGCKKASCGHTKITKTHFVASVCTTICRFSWKKRLKMAISWSKVWIFGLSPILRVLDVKKQVVVTHRSRKHNLQHPYAPKFAIFHEKTANNGRFFGQKLRFLGSPLF